MVAKSAFSQSSEAERHLLPPVLDWSRIWLWGGLAALVLLVFVSRGLWEKPPEMLGDEHPAVGRELEFFELKPLTGDGKDVTLADLAGKATLVNFWGPWCGACAVEFPRLIEIEAHFKSDPGFQFFSISANGNPLDDTGLAASTIEFLKQHQATFATYRDPQAETRRAVEVALETDQFGYPTTLLIGPDQKLRGVWSGYVPGDEKDVQRVIEKVLQEVASFANSDSTASSP